VSSVESRLTVEDIARSSRAAAATVAKASTDQKNAALRAMRDRLAARQADIISANEADVTVASSQVDATAPAWLDRLRFGPAKIESRMRSLDKIAALSDPVGEPIDVRRLANGLEAARVRVPLGVILMIYEARPHVTVNAGALCLKAGNAAILRGGSEARQCNDLLGELWQESLAEAGMPETAIQVVSGSHGEITELLQLNDYIDLVIPRGGEDLIRSVAATSRIPVIKHFAGICHVYVDEGADIERAIDIALDSKCLMPEVCNAMETLLVAEGAASALPRIVDALRRHDVLVKGCERTRSLVPGLEPATEEDWRTEYLDLSVAVRVVAGVEEAIDHINHYGSHHTDSIVTDSESRARRFLNEVDSAVVLLNASTMFCDGESLGMGAEIGISTDRLHARGPMGLRELTSYKLVIRGDGHIMGGPYQS